VKIELHLISSYLDLRVVSVTTSFENNNKFYELYINEILSLFHLVLTLESFHDIALKFRHNLPKFYILKGAHFTDATFKDEIFRPMMPSPFGRRPTLFQANWSNLSAQSLALNSTLQ